MSETLSKRCRVRSRHWPTLGIFCLAAVTPFGNAWAQDEAADDAGDDAPALKPEGKAAPAEAPSEEDAALAEADAAAMAEEGAGDAELKRAPTKGKGVI